MALLQRPEHLSDRLPLRAVGVVGIDGSSPQTFRELLLGAANDRVFALNYAHRDRTVAHPHPHHRVHRSLSRLEFQ